MSVAVKILCFSTKVHVEIKPIPGGWLMHSITSAPAQRDAGHLWGRYSSS